MRKAALLAAAAALFTAMALGQASSSSQSSQGTRVYNDDQNATQRATQADPQQDENPPVLTRRPAQRRTEPATAPETGRTREIPAGTEIRATLDTPLSTKTSHVGDRFTATVTQPVNGSGGAVAIPAGAKIQGEVTEAEQGKILPAVRGKGKLNLRFHDISLPNGETVPLEATLTSLRSTKNNAKAGDEGEVTSGRTTGQTAKDVGIGAGAGTLAGLLFGHVLRGLAIGAVAGGGYVLATNGKDVELPADTGLVLKTDRNISIPAVSGAH
jgi:hypothetical protein